jgi:hypothetical protein
VCNREGKRRGKKYNTGGKSAPPQQHATSNQIGKNEVRVSNLGELARRKSMEGKLGFGMGTCKEKKNGGKIGFRIWRNL